MQIRNTFQITALNNEVEQDKIGHFIKDLIATNLLRCCVCNTHPGQHNMVVFRSPNLAGPTQVPNIGTTERSK